MDLDEKINTMWEEMTNNIKKMAIEVLGKSKGKGQSDKKTWWWNKKFN